MTHATSPKRPSSQRSRPAPRGSAVSSRRVARIPTGGGTGIPAALAPRKEPRQRRSAATVEAILDASAELLVNRGYARISTNQIAARAGVSVGSLYQYFPNKDALMTALVERHQGDVEDVIVRTLTRLSDVAVPIRPSMRAMLVELGAVHAARPTRTRAVEEATRQSPELGLLSRRRDERFRQLLVTVLDARADVRPGNHALMAVLFAGIAESVTRALMHGHARTFDMDETLEEATEAMCGYLERREPASARSRPASGRKMPA